MSADFNPDGTARSAEARDSSRVEMPAGTVWERAGDVHYTRAAGRGSSRSRFVPLAELARRVGPERVRNPAARAFPVRWPRAYLDLANPADPADPILRMGLPDPRELEPDALGSSDPVGEAALSETPFLVRKYADRALLLVAARCHFYCRFCFRRSFPDGGHRDPSRAELERALERLACLEGVRELILSGGDPLVLEDARLEWLVARVARMSGIERLRVHTRAPVVMPERVTPELCRILAGGPPCRIVTHFNHPVELTGATSRVVELLGSHAIPLASQSVLLAGVNDSAETLELLLRQLAREGIEAYYLHHTDHARGNAHFRVSIERGLALHAELARRLPQELLPRYVIDLPDGSGKIEVRRLERLGPFEWRYVHPGGRVSQVREDAPKRAPL